MTTLTFLERNFHFCITPCHVYIGVNKSSSLNWNILLTSFRISMFTINSRGECSTNWHSTIISSSPDKCFRLHAGLITDCKSRRNACSLSISSPIHRFQLNPFVTISFKIVNYHSGVQSWTEKILVTPTNGSLCFCMWHYFSVFSVFSPTTFYPIRNT